MKLIVFILFLILSTGCNSQEKKIISAKSIDETEIELGSPIAQYVTCVFEDAMGDLWFCTLQKGIAKYDGENLQYITMEDGLPSDRVTGIIQDSDGAYLLNTGDGISKYDGYNFTNFSANDDLRSNSISTLFIDSKGTFWVGTWGGVYIFKAGKFTLFPLPDPEVATSINPDTKDWITDITEDADGNIWISRDGYGIYNYDGKSFNHILKKDGLHSNNVTDLEIDAEGSIWIGTRVAEKDNPIPELRKGKGGVNRLINNEIISFPDIDAFNNNDVYEIYIDKSDNVWICTVHNGVYKYDGESFKHYDVPISIMGIETDRNGTLWLGGAGGLYKINSKDEVINVTTKGPWK